MPKITLGITGLKNPVGDPRRSRARNRKEMYEKAWHVQSCCFAYHKTYCFLTFSLPSRHRILSPTCEEGQIR